MNDLISREEAIDAIVERTHMDWESMKILYPMLEVIDNLPTVYPKKGKWIKISPANIYECSVCHQNVMAGDIEEYHFCHHCGADMRESN